MSKLNSIDPNIIFNAKPASLPGAHAPAGFVSPEYDEDIVTEQVLYHNKCEKLSLNEMKAHQLDRLRELLVYSGKHVPYWRSLFQELKFNPLSINSIGDLQQLPLLTKDMIKDDYKAFVSDIVDPNTVTYMTTGGSTGSPLKILMDREYRSRSHAATRYYLSKAGITPGRERGIRLHGNTISDEIISNGEYWVAEGNRLTMSVSHISTKSCSDYMNAIRDFKPNYIHAYASALVLLTQYANQQNEKYPDSIVNVFCDSETIYPWQRKLIFDATGARLFNIYGHTEGAGMAITFPNLSYLEALPQVGVMEILNKDGQTLVNPGEHGEIVVTGFNNKIMPFIRYQTYDMAVIGTSPKKPLRPYQPILESIEGRLQDYLITSDFTLIPAAPMLFDYNFDWTGIDVFQVKQVTRGALEFKIVPSNEFDVSIIENKVIRNFTQIFGNKFKITVSFHLKLSCSSRGKFRYVDQHLNINE